MGSLLFTVSGSCLLNWM